MTETMRPSDPAPGTAPAATPDGVDAGGGPSTGTRLSPTEIHENVREAAEEELDRPAAELWWSAVNAGLLIGFSTLGAAYVASVVPHHLRQPASALGYPLGFVFIVLSRAQLFTENTLEPVVPLLEHRDARTLRSMLRLWAIVLAGNVVGTLLIALALAKLPIVDSEMRQSLLLVSTHGTSGAVMPNLLRGVFGGWLVALMAWLVASTRATGAQIALVVLTTLPIAALNFRHSIAGAVEAFYRASMGGATWASMIVDFLLPTLVGNVIGGSVLVALLNHGQTGDRRGKWATAD